MTRARIAIAFFGIVRSLVTTLPSIEAHVVQPARRHGAVKTFSHLYDVQAVVNPRSGEDGGIPSDAATSLVTDVRKVEDPSDVQSLPLVPYRNGAYDPYGDDWSSVRNLVLQLHSLHSVTRALSEWQPDVACFVRPDLTYHDDIGPIVAEAVRPGPPTVWLPGWQSFRGFNDRFAVVRGADGIQRYGRRIEAIEAYRARYDDEIHAESLLRHALEGVDVRFVEARATRVRSGGRFERESFRHDRPLETSIDRVAPFSSTKFRVRNRWATFLTSVLRTYR